MKRYLGLMVTLLGAGAAIYLAAQRYTKLTADHQRDVAAAKLKSDYADRVVWVRVNPDEKSYRNDVQNLLRAWFKDVNEFFNRHGGNRNFDEYLEELAARKGDKSQDAKKKIYDSVRKAFDGFKGGNYDPLFTATDKGIRLDVVSTQVVNEGGEPKVRYQLVVWGLPREERVDDRNVRKVISNASFSIVWKFFDDKGKLVNEMNASGDPSMRIDWPERYIRFFPPNVMIGHYDVDKIPSNIKSAEIAFSIGAGTLVGSSIAANYTWKLDVPAEWKMGEGEVWKGAQESVRSEEEIDPSKAEKN